VSVVADEWAAGDAPLAGLAAHAPAGPWGDILADHLEALRALAARAIEQRRDLERRAAAIGVTTGYRLPTALRAHTDG
jgi:GAF domain-containing protein